jgi:hypothetical protein
MSKLGWSYLISRFGTIDTKTTDENIRLAVREMFHEDHPDLLEGDYEEHSVAWVDYGFDEGPVYTMLLRRFGCLTLEKRNDQDDIDPIESFQLIDVDEDHCIRLFISLVSGDIVSIFQDPWKKTEI